MAAADSLVARIDEQLSKLLAGWTPLSTVLALLIAALITYTVLTRTDPDTHPLLLARQAYTSPIRNQGESAVHRSTETPYGYPLKSGLDIREVDGPRWTAGRDGDVRDIWRAAIRGFVGPDGKETGQRGKIVRVLGTEGVVDCDLDEMSREINVIGQHIRQGDRRRVAIYLPNSTELLTTLFAAAFYKLTPILLPYEQSEATILQLLERTKPDVLVATAGTVPLAGCVERCAGLKEVVWVVQRGSLHLGYEEVPKEVHGKIGASVWLDLVEKGSALETTAELPVGKAEDGETKIVTIWQEEKDDVGEVVEFSQKNIVSAVAALISHLPPRQRLNPSDLFQPIDALTGIYPLCLTLAALYSNANVALNSVAGHDADLRLATRGIRPTVVVASAETAAGANAKAAAGNTGPWARLSHHLHGLTLASGRMPSIARAVADDTLPATATPPGKLRLVYVSERAGCRGCPPLSSSALSDLRIYTGARVVYALTAGRVAGAVAQTHVYDYRRDDGWPEKHGHFGAPLASVEIKLVEVPRPKTTTGTVSVGKMVVKGPAVEGEGEVNLGVLGGFRDDGTVVYV
ncbi:MAG: hypothetical protein M1832_002816 [Thelocarpon impressellum]|nr:MAG: hypothetical protein M1832_002816 [Thelocarpon impressellum]